MTLSVNLNKVALLRNTRRLGIPSVTRAATLVLEAGAQGITVHPRPDERHIRAQDVQELAALLRDWPHVEYNIEGNPFHNLMDFVRELAQGNMPLHQCTFVPDSVGQLTSDHGFDLAADGERLQPLIAAGAVAGRARQPVHGSGARSDATGTRGRRRSRRALHRELCACARHAAAIRGARAVHALRPQAAIAAGLGVNAGHDLNRANLTDFLRAVPGVQEVSIGHAFIADALELGYAEAVRDYQRCIQRALPLRPRDRRHRHRRVQHPAHRARAATPRRTIRRARARRA